MIFSPQHHVASFLPPAPVGTSTSVPLSATVADGYKSFSNEVELIYSNVSPLPLIIVFGAQNPEVKNGGRI